jgi:hypothetical protein
MVDATAVALLFVLSQELGATDFLRRIKLVVVQSVVDELLEFASHDQHLAGRNGANVWLHAGRLMSAPLDTLAVHSELLEFVRDQMDVVPVSAMLDSTELDGNLRAGLDTLGYATAHTLLEASHTRMAVLVDDLFTGRVARELMGIRKLGTRALLGALLDAEQITTAQYSRLLSLLAHCGCGFIPLRPRDVVGVCSGALWRWNDDVRGVLSALRGPDCSQEDAVRVVAAALGEFALEREGPGDALFVMGIMDVAADGRHWLQVAEVILSLLHDSLHLAPIALARVVRHIDGWIAMRS